MQRDQRNTILSVGCMAQHTLGRRFVERRRRLKTWGVKRELRARVEVIDIPARGEALELE